MAINITENLWRLDIPLVGNPLKNLNGYLITGERSLLIDTGFRQESCREALNRQLDELGVDRDHMDIFLTHRHSDHAGMAPETIRPGCKVYIGEIDGTAIEKGLGGRLWKQAYPQYLASGFSEQEILQFTEVNPAQVGAPVEWKQYVYLQDGAELRYGGHTLRCIWTPGHTPGHFCLYEPERQWLFSGDHVLFHITPNICRWPEVADSLGDYLDSLKRIRELPVKLLLPAHREETGDLAQRVDELLAHHARRLENTAECMRNAPEMTAYALAGKMRWQIRSRSWEEFPLAQKIFAVGETMAHLDYLERCGKVRWEMKNGVRYYSLVPQGQKEETA